MNQGESVRAENRWFEAENIGDITSPALLVYPDRVEENISRMVGISQDIERLRPHVKTHKMSEILRLQLKHGISKCKCSTIAEAELAANCEIEDILLAYQPVGPNIPRLISLIRCYPESNISVIADSETIIQQLADSAREFNLRIDAWLDINNGMNRTGHAPDRKAIALYKLIYSLPNLKVRGLHVYDGHIHDSDFNVRKQLCDEAYLPVNSLIEQLEKSGLPVPTVVAGGTPTFPIHATRKNTETSPGTILLWDYGYGSSFPDLDFLQAALVFTRIVSKPGKNLLCFDLGHKALASEMPHPRVKIIGLDNYIVRNHSEEHLVIETKEADKFKIGNLFYGIPVHICPTVVRYDSAYIVRNKMITGSWAIEARDRKINI